MAVMCLEETGDSLANRTRLVRQLLDQGMPADYSDDGKTLLHTCARKGLTSFAKELIDRGANVNARFDDLKEFARGNPMLAKQSAEWRGATPLMFAAQQGYKSCVRLLLEHGARIDIRLPDETRFPFRPGANAALMAELSGHAEVARLINEFSSDKGRATGRHAREPPQTPSRAQRLAEDEAAFDAITQDALAREIMTDAEHDVLTDRLASGHASFGAIVNKLLETGTGVELTGLSKAPE